jgi:hypothetical protein
MDKWEDYPVRVLGIAPLIMVTLSTVSSFSSGGVVVGPRRPPPLVVASFESGDPPREWSLSYPSSLACGWPLARMALSSANGGGHTELGLHHLHAQEMGGRTDVGMGQSDRPGPIDPSPFRPGSVAPSHTWVLLPFCTLPPSLASFWRHHPRVQDRGSSRIKFGLLRFNPWGCSFVTLRSSPPLVVISSCTWTRTGLLICSFKLVVTLSF